MEVGLVRSILIDAGWARVLPERAALLLEAISSLEPVSSGLLHVRLVQTWGLDQGLRAAAWTAVEQWTGAELERAGIDTADARETNLFEVKKRSDDARLYELRLREMSLEVDHSVGGMLRLLLACGVVVSASDGQVSVSRNPPRAVQILPSPFAQ